MNAEGLLAHYARITEAPAAIPRLRRFVLDLAVRGKLAHQDPNDEPAAELLKGIAAERKARISRAAIRQSKSPDPIENAPFELPSGWSWVPLGETGNIFTGNSVNDPTREQLERTQEGRPFIATKDVGYGLDRIKYANGLLVKFSDERFKIARPGSVLICAEGGSAGRKIGLTDREVCFGNKLLANETSSVVSPRFVLYVYMSDFFYSQFAEKMTGVISGISIGKFVELLFPLPPFVEQQRIVAKVDELMALCDRLEAARARREATRDRLSVASLARLSAPEPDAFRDGVRFSLNALPELTARADQIKQLGRAFLDLAMRGRLVPHYPDDEPPLGETRPPPTGAEVPFAAPSGWQWCDFGQVAEFENGDRGKNYPNRSEYVDKGVAWINTGHIQPNGALSVALMNYITKAKYDSLGGGKIKANDLVYCLRGATFGKTAFVDPFTKGAIASSLMIIRPGRWIDRRFTYFYLISPLGRSQLLRFDNGTAQPNLSSGNVKKYLIPVPPLAEQHRIVEKVNQLMTLCDRLEANLAYTGDIRCRLLEALLAETLAPNEGQELEAAE